VLGVAARNLQVDRDTNVNNPRTAAVSYQRGIEDQVGGVRAEAAGATTAALERAHADSEDRRDTARNAVALQEVALRRPEAKPIVLEDGTVAEYGADNVARPIVDIKGKPVKQLEQKPLVDPSGYAKTFSEFLNGSLQKDPTTGAFVVKGTDGNETEERELQNRLEGLWVRIDDLRKKSVERNIAFLRVAASATATFLDNVFGRGLISLRL